MITSKYHMPQSKPPAAQKVAFTSFLVNVIDICLNLFVSILTGSVIMTTQWLQGLADLASSGLIINGIRLSSRPPDRHHPFGYGREMFFWTLLSGLIMISITATIAFYLGFHRFFSPEPLERPLLAIAVISVGVLTNGYALSLSTRRLFSNSRSYWSTFLHSPLVETKTTLILDLTGTLASLTGLIALILAQLTHDYRFDGLGAMLIALFLLILALFLLMSVRDLIIGRSADTTTQKRIIKITKAIPGVQDVLDLRTSIIGPETILVNLEIHAQHNLSTVQIEKLIDLIKATLIKKVPNISHIQVELETPEYELVHPGAS